MIDIDETLLYFIGSTPHWVNKKSWDELYKRIIDSHSDMIFITTRYSYNEEYTKEHFKHLGLEYKNVYHTSAGDKGEFAFKNFNREIKGRPKILLDDLTINLIEMKNYYPETHVYQFQRLE